MNPDNVPVWGCPWHGLVSNGQLPLPNGQSMPWPQPGSGRWWMYGSTALLQHPQAVPITRTPDEVAADAAAGRQWRHQAMISGGTIYGRSLQAGWIYIDSAGECWLATTTLGTEHLAGGICELRLRRFGVLGGQPEEHTYFVTVPDLGQATPPVSGSLGIELYHTAPRGNAAVFEVAVELTSGAQRWWPNRPVGWVEMTLSGPGSSCSAAVVVRRTREQTLGVWSESLAAVADDDWFIEYLPDSTSRLVREPPTNSNTYLLACRHRMINGDYTAGTVGYVVGMIYSPAGVLQAITLDESLVTTYTVPPAIHTGPTEFADGVPLSGSWSSTYDTDSDLTLTYRIDGTQAAEYRVSIVESVSDTGVISPSGDSYTTNVQTVTDPAGSYSAQVTAPTWERTLGGGVYGVLNVAPAPIIGGGVAYNWPTAGGDRRLQIIPYRYANTMFGMGHWWTPITGNDSSVDYLPDVATPSGAITLPQLSLSLSTPSSSFELQAFGSWCPVTGQAARAANQICWV